MKGSAATTASAIANGTLSDIQPDLSLLQEDIAALKRDVANLVQHAKTGAANGARSAADQVADTGRRSAEMLSDRIEEQPITAVLIALGIGYIGGRLMSR